MKRILKIIILNTMLFGQITCLRLLNDDHTNVAIGSDIKLSFEREGNNAIFQAKRISPQAIEVFISLFTVYSSTFDRYQSYKSFVDDLAAHPVELNKQQHLQICSLALFFDLPIIAHAKAQSYIEKYARHETIESFFEPTFAIENNVKHLLRKHYFLMHDDKQVMSYTDETDINVQLTLTFQEALCGRKIIINNTKLDLSNLLLSSLDGIEYWLNAPQVQQLDLSNNCLKILPSIIRAGSYLKRLDLSNNQLKHVPEEINHLSNLEALNVSNNQLKKLPDSIGSLKKLWRLDANNNRLKTLPETIASCDQLRWLSLNDNDIETVPDNLKSLPLLRKLRLNNSANQTT